MNLLSEYRRIACQWILIIAVLAITLLSNRGPSTGLGRTIHVGLGNQEKPSRQPYPSSSRAYSTLPFHPTAAVAVEECLC
jgi:hypothetical protein